MRGCTITGVNQMIPLFHIEILLKHPNYDSISVNFPTFVTLRLFTCMLWTTVHIEPLIFSLFHAELWLPHMCMCDTTIETRWWPFSVKCNILISDKRQLHFLPNVFDSHRGSKRNRWVKADELELSAAEESDCKDNIPIYERITRSDPRISMTLRSHPANDHFARRQLQLHTLHRELQDKWIFNRSLVNSVSFSHN